MQKVPQNGECVITSYSIHYTKLYDKDKNDLVEKIFEFEKGCSSKRFEDLNINQFNAIDQLFEANKMFLSIIRDHNPSSFYDLKKRNNFV